MTTRQLKQCRKAYRHIVSDAVRLDVPAVQRRHRMQYFESFPVQVRRIVIGG